MPVGSISGTANASGGSANYSIPIILPTGTNGVNPELNLGYNSMGANGPIGMGWSISGFSMISRTNKNIYFDSNTNPIDFSTNDRFVLDGERLITKIGTYGANLSTYVKESEDFSTVTSYGNYGGGPFYFKVETKDGIVFEYGNTSDSKFLNADNTKVLYWKLNRILYKDGNYIDYKYISSDNELLIDEINYTGNILTGMVPYNKIKFNYLIREDRNKSFEVGKAIMSNSLLNSLVITTENNTAFKNYYFYYGHNNIISFLKEIKESGSDGTLLNSTIFKYGDEPIGFQYTTPGISPTSAYDLFSGDFDADGYTDMLFANYAYINSQKYHTGFKVYKRTADNTTYINSYSVTFPSGEYYKIIEKNIVANGNAFMTSDFDGDGDDDIMIVKMISTSDGMKVDRGDLYLSQGDGYNFTIYNINFPDPPSGSIKEHINPDGRSFNIGDFNGDGRGDFLFMNIFNYNNSWHRWVYVSYGGTNPLSSWQSVFCDETINIPVTDWVEVAEKIYIIDYDGDTKSDILVIDEGESEIFKFDYVINSKVKRIYYGGYPTKWHLLFFGDFNGDQKTDLLARWGTDTNTNPWYKSLNTGSGFEETPITFNHTPNITGSYSDDKLIITDFNSDGKQDIYHGWNYFVNGVATTSRLDLYYSKGINFYYTQHVHNKLLSFNPNIVFDLNGDGRSDIVNKVSTDPIDVFYFRKEGQENILQKIKNGVDHDIEFSYKRMTQTANFFYIRGELTAHPVNNFQAPIYLVSQQKLENGIGGYLTIDFRYLEAKVHKEGKGFLGFKKITAIDNVLGINTIWENELNTLFYILLPYKTSKYLNSPQNLLNEVTNSNVCIDLYNKRFWTRINSVYENKAFEGQFINSSFTYDSYGNITNTTVNTNDITTKSISSQFGQYGTPIPAKLTSETITIIRTGQDVFSYINSYSYNSFGQLTSKTEFSGLPKWISTIFTYNSLGNQTGQSISPSGLTARTSSVQYDTKGRFIISSTNPMNQTTTYTNDIKWGKPTLVSGITNLQTSYGYDAFGRETYAFDPQKQITINTSYNWNIDASSGTIHKKTITHPGKPDIIVYYDILDRERRKDVQIFGNTWSSQYFTYDVRGNLFTSTLPYKTGEVVLTTTNLYDIYNRLSSSANTIGTTSYSYTYNNGKLTTSITNPAGQVKSQVTDATGKMTSSTDNGGTLDYTYYSNGNIKEVKQGSQTLSSHVYDEYGRQTSMTDINAGTTQYVTDALGQITSMITATSQTITYIYDIMGRKTNYTRPEGSTTYTFYPTGSGGATNQLNTVTTYGGITEQYNYDTYGRISSKVETIDAISHTTSYTYDIYDNLKSQTYPSGFICNYNYDANGYLDNIKNGTNTLTLYTQTSTNGLGNTTGYNMGNGKSSSISYYFGTPTNFTTTGVQNLTLNWNYQSGNLTSRVDAIKNKTESFTYDNLNRLLSSYGTGITTLTNSYAANGNISSKTDAGNYFYETSKINAVTKVSNGGANISATTQDIVYTSFYQPLSITEGTNRIDFTYAADDQRIKTVRKQNNVIVDTKYFFGDYEKYINPGVTRHLHYILTPSGLSCIVERIGSTDTYHYTYTDHLGSILTVTNSSGIVEYEQNFDAWGRNRNATTWAYSNIAIAPEWLYRGFTGHEHLKVFGLINMNGRLYDPIVGRMLSPDNNVQMPDYTQNHNRYSYALNNPLKYTDPDGEVIQLAPILIGMAIGAASYTTIHLVTHDFTFKDWSWGAFAGSVVAGAVGGIVTPALTAAGIGGFYGGAISGAASGFSSNLTAGIINGDEFKTIMKKSFGGALMGATIGGVVGGIGAKIKGNRFSDGAKIIEKKILADQNIPSGVIQDGTMNCGPANVEIVDRSFGGNTTQYDVRGKWFPGTTGENEIGFRDLWKAYEAHSGHTVSGLKPENYELIPSLMNSGERISVNLNVGVSNIGHGVVIDNVVSKTFQRVNGQVFTKIIFNAMNPEHGLIQAYSADAIKYAFGIVRILP